MDVRNHFALDNIVAVPLPYAVRTRFRSAADAAFVVRTPNGAGPKPDIMSGMFFCSHADCSTSVAANR